jgi:putative SOS response-associated peptidase YedK
MCGRYYSLFDKQQVAEHFHVRRTADNVGIIAPNYNAAPGDPQPVVRRSRDTGERELVMMRWGIVPWFAKTEDEFKALSTINAKSDRLTDSKMWREPFAKGRCLVPASGLYEWPKEGKAISQFYHEIPAVEEETGDSGNLFGTPLKAPKKAKKAKGIKRVFKVPLTDEGGTPFAFAGIWDA